MLTLLRFWFGLTVWSTVLEAGFGPCHATARGAFRTLQDASNWIQEQLEADLI